MAIDAIAMPGAPSIAAGPPETQVAAGSLSGDGKTFSDVIASAMEQPAASVEGATDAVGEAVTPTMPAVNLALLVDGDVTDGAQDLAPLTLDLRPDRDAEAEDVTAALAALMFGGVLPRPTAAPAATAGGVASTPVAAMAAVATIASLHATGEAPVVAAAAAPVVAAATEETPDSAPVQLRTQRLTRVFSSGGWFGKHREVRAADAVDIALQKGETLGIVGESGSGKSTVARMIAHLIEPTSGEIVLDDAPVARLRGAAAHAFRRKVQVVFQDPYRSLNPRRTVGAAIAEGPMNFGASREAAWARAGELMQLVKLPPHALHRYPHEFSGGQRQRICIARALAVDPEVLIADEAVSALDVSVQAQILTLLEELQQRLGLTLLFITHDLRVAAQICNRVVVMHHGRVVEHGPVGALFTAPAHAYTRALLAAAPGRGYAFHGAAPAA